MTVATLIERLVELPPPIGAILVVAIAVTIVCTLAAVSWRVLRYAVTRFRKRSKKE